MAGTYTVRLSLNGEQAEPTRFGAITFEAFNLSSVRLSNVTPACFAVGSNTTLTIEGSHFAEYGSPTSHHLVCKVGDQLVPATLLNSSFLQCAVAAFTAPGVAAVSVSLNAGRPGTFSSDELFVTAYQPPTISGISPIVGDANGGELVTISGSGFTASCPSELRCAFGGVIQPQPPSLITASRVECLTTWGKSTSTGDGVRVGLSMDRGILFHTNSLVRFEFQGFHRPQLVDAYFSIDATRLIMKFDSQPTNQAGLGGLGRVSCDLLLDEATSNVLRGRASFYPDCIWTANEVVALLAMHTDAAPGIRVGFKPATIWPAEWSYPGSCAGQGSKCNTAASSQISIQSFFPCDIRHTPTTEACVTPTASIRAPASISSCSNASLTLRVDGLSSGGSGIKPLSFTWGADPISCDNFYPIQAKLDEQNAAQATTITLDGSLLAGGETFVYELIAFMVMQARNSLGVKSATTYKTVTRAALPIPTVQLIEVPELLHLKAGMSLTLSAEILQPPCLENQMPTIIYEWNNTAVTALSPTAPAVGIERLTLDPLTRVSRALNFAGSGMLYGLVYTLRLTACLEADPSRCDFAEIDLTLEKEPLLAYIEGGQALSVGAGSPFSLNACSSCIPAVTEGQSSCEGLLFEWACTPLSDAAVCPILPLGRQQECTWTVGSDSFTVGNYSLSVNVTTLLLTEQSAACTRVEVIQSDISVAIATHMNVFALHAEPNNNERGLHLTASIASDTDAEIAYSWSIASEQSYGDFSSLTSTGLFLSDLVLLPGVLRAGASYTFRPSTNEWPPPDARCHPHQVDATSALGGTASSWLTLKTNAPPFGGTMRLSPDPPYLALLGAITLTASQWFDDPEDLPLLYSFFYGDSPQAAEESWTPMSQAKLYPTHIWRNPPAGNFTLSCKVMDVFGAETVTQRQSIVEQQTPLDSSSFERLLLEIETRIAHRDAPGAIQLMDSLAITLNSQCSSPSQEFVEPGLCSSLRGSLIGLLGSQSVEGISSLATQQRASLLRSLVSRPSELALDAMENASVLVGELLRVSTAGVSSGTAAKLLGSISSLLEGTSREAQEEKSDSSLNRTNCSGCVAALRSERLRNHTAWLAELALEGKAVGETPTAFSTHMVAIRALREDPCRVENISIESAQFEGGGGGGSVFFPQGTLCARRAERRMQASSSCGDTPVSLFLLTFKSATRPVSPTEPLGTPVYSVQVKQCGEERKVSDVISPIRLKMMPLPHTSSSNCQLATPLSLPAPSTAPPSSPPVAPNEDCHLLHARGNCTEDEDCHAPTGGKCLEGMCVCHPGYLGSECEIATSCRVLKRAAQPQEANDANGNMDTSAPNVKNTRVDVLPHRLMGRGRAYTDADGVLHFSAYTMKSERERLKWEHERAVERRQRRAQRKQILELARVTRASSEGRSAKDDEALTASQERSVMMVQLFFNALMVDFVFACLNAPDISSATGGGRRGRGSAAEDAAHRNAFRIDQFSKIDLVNATITGFVSAIAISITIRVCKFFFRWGNSTHLTHRAAARRDANDRVRSSVTADGSNRKGLSFSAVRVVSSVISSCLGCCLLWKHRAKLDTNCAGPEAPVGESDIDVMELTCSPPGSPPESSSPANPPKSKDPSDAPSSDAHTMAPGDQISCKQLKNHMSGRSSGGKTSERAQSSEEQLSGVSGSPSHRSKLLQEIPGSPGIAVVTGSPRRPDEVLGAAVLLSADRSLSSPFKLLEQNSASRMATEITHARGYPRKATPPSTRRFCLDDLPGSSSERD
ncbi:MAG: hypothetical protein SGPRY_003073, partial [Prymnesium sp.]